MGSIAECEYRPIVSIITVTYNAEKTLEKTINSVIKQDKSLFEYIIIDGSSKDDTVKIIKKFSDKLSYWISEPDSGIYEAMNKGIDMAKGSWLYFLGADDVLTSNIIKKMEINLEDDNMIVFGDVQTTDGRIISSFFSCRTLLQNTVHHQGAFYNKLLFKNFRYKANLKILSDYELNLKIYVNNLPSKKTHLIVAICATGGASSNLDISLKETNFIRNIYINRRYINSIFSATLRLYYFQKKMRSSLCFYI